jgi:hypothetical protein
MLGKILAIVCVLAMVLGSLIISSMAIDAWHKHRDIITGIWLFIGAASTIFFSVVLWLVWKRESGRRRGRH